MNIILKHEISFIGIKEKAILFNKKQILFKGYIAKEEVVSIKEKDEDIGLAIEVKYPLFTSFN